MYLWHEQQEYHLRNDAYKRPRHDQHHLCPRGSRSKNPNPWCQTKGGGNGQDWRPTYLQNWNSWKDPIWNFRQVIILLLLWHLTLLQIITHNVNVKCLHNHVRPDVCTRCLLKCKIFIFFMVSCPTFYRTDDDFKCIDFSLISNFLLQKLCGNG